MQSYQRRHQPVCGQRPVYQACHVAGLATSARSSLHTPKSSNILRCCSVRNEADLCDAPIALAIQVMLPGWCLWTAAPRKRFTACLYHALPGLPLLKLRIFISSVEAALIDLQQHEVRQHKKRCLASSYSRQTTCSNLSALLSCSLLLGFARARVVDGAHRCADRACASSASNVASSALLTKPTKLVGPRRPGSGVASYPASSATGQSPGPCTSRSKCLYRAKFHSLMWTLYADSLQLGASLS